MLLLLNATLKYAWATINTIKARLGITHFVEGYQPAVKLFGPSWGWTGHVIETVTVTIFGLVTSMASGLHFTFGIENTLDHLGRVDCCLSHGGRRG